MLTIRETRLDPGQTRSPSRICLWKRSALFLSISWLPPCSPWHCRPRTAPGISQEEPGPVRQPCSFSWAPGRSCARSCEARHEGDTPHPPQLEGSLSPPQGPASSRLPRWQHPFGYDSPARLPASCVSVQEQWAPSHCKCLLEMGQPGLLAAAVMLPASASQRLQGSGFIGGMGRADHEQASQGEPASTSQARTICAPYLGNRT